MKSIFTLILVIILNMCLSSLVPNQFRAQGKDTSETGSLPPNNYYLKTAKMYVGLEDYAKAVDSLELAILLEPDNAEARTLLKESRRLLAEKKSSPA
ncbi:MAG: hypothetical protein ACK41Q_14195, partial [Candidatus Brocadia sp.]